MTHASEWLKLKRPMTAPGIDKDTEHQIAFLVEGQIGTTTLENYLIMSTKEEYRLTLLPEISHLLYVPNINAQSCAPKYMLKPIHGNVKYNSKNSKQSKWPSIRMEWIQSWGVVIKGILQVKENEWAVATSMSLKRY